MRKVAVARKKLQKKPLTTNDRPIRWVLDCSAPANDGLIDTRAFVDYLSKRIKIQGKAGNLGNKVLLRRAKGNILVTVKSGTKVGKRYLKYLTKKYLKKNSLRDFLHIITTKRNAYALKYYNIAAEEGEKQEE